MAETGPHQLMLDSLIVVITEYLQHSKSPSVRPLKQLFPRALATSNRFSDGSEAKDDIVVGRERTVKYAEGWYRDPFSTLLVYGSERTPWIQSNVWEKRRFNSKRAESFCVRY